MGYLPIVLDVAGRRCAVFGSGAVAAAKARQLLELGARVLLVAASPGPELRDLISSPPVDHRRRYAAGDLDGAFLVFAEPDADDLPAVWRDAEDRGVPMNVMDDVPHCSFIVPSIVRRGDLLVAISTSGRAPALAVRLRQELEARLGSHHARFLELAGRLRRPLARRVPDGARRKELWYRLVDSDVLALLARGDDEAARRRIGQIVGFDPDEVAA